MFPCCGTTPAKPLLIATNTPADVHKPFIFFQGTLVHVQTLSLPAIQALLPACTLPGNNVQVADEVGLDFVELLWRSYQVGLLLMTQL